MNRHYVAATAALLATGGVLYAAVELAHPPVAWAVVAAVFVLASSVAHDLACDRLSGWCVYGLFTSKDLDDRPGVHLIYVGKTGDVHRRALQHTEDTDTEPWRKTITHVIVLRSCHSEAQAERIEERRIKALAVASKWSMTGTIHNDLHTRRATDTLTAGWRATWAVAYWMEQILRPHLRWIDNMFAHPIPLRDDDEFYATDPDTIDPDAPRYRRTTATEASYERTMTVAPMLALPPVGGWGQETGDSEVGGQSCPPTGTPVGGPTRDDGTPGQATGHGGRGTHLADRIHAAQQPTKKRAKPPKTRAATPHPDREARRRWSEAEKKRSQRARARGEEYEKQPYPG